VLTFNTVKTTLAVIFSRKRYFQGQGYRLSEGQWVTPRGAVRLTKTERRRRCVSNGHHHRRHRYKYIYWKRLIFFRVRAAILIIDDDQVEEEEEEETHFIIIYNVWKVTFVVDIRFPQ